MKAPFKTYTGWAISTNFTGLNGREYPCYIGRYWWFKGTPPVIPAQLEGHHYCVFKTQKLAREYWSEQQSKAFPDAKVVKVKITIEVAK